MFQKEDIACAVGIQQGLASGANAHLTAGRAEQGIGRFHASVPRIAGAGTPRRRSDQPGLTFARATRPSAARPSRRPAPRRAA